MLDVKLDLMRRLRSHVRAPYLVHAGVSCLQWRLSDTEDLVVVVDARDVFSSWIEGSGRDPLLELEAGTAEQLLGVLIPFLGREGGRHDAPQRRKADTMKTIDKLTDSVRARATLLMQKARYQVWLATSAEMLAELLEELKKLDVGSPEWEPSSYKFVWEISTGALFVYVAQSDEGLLFSARVDPLSVSISPEVLFSESVPKTAAWIASKLAELKRAESKGAE